MSRRITAGNDAPFRWAVKLQGKPFDLSGKDVKVYVINSRGEIPVARLTIEGHEVSGVFEGRYQTRLGEHSLVLRVNEGRPEMKTAAVANVFELVQWSADAGGSDESDVIVAPVLIESEISIGGVSYDDTEVKNELARLEREKADKSELTDFLTREEFNEVSERFASADRVQELSENVTELSQEKEDKTNKVTSLTEESTDEQYPSAKVVYALKERIEENELLIDDLFDTKIDKEADDYYPQLAVGLADNLSGVDVVASEVNFRRSGGGAISDGVARIEAIKGNSVVWHQYYAPRKEVLGTQVKNGVTFSVFEDGTIQAEGTAEGGSAVCESFVYVDFKSSHKYILIAVGAPEGKWNRQGLYFSGGNLGSINTYTMIESEGYKIFQPQGEGKRATITLTAWAGYSLSCKFRPIFCDLTQMFGAGNEPTTIEEFYARIPMGVDLNAYNEGEVIHMDVQSIESVGVNQWDEEWELGKLATSTGALQESAKYIRTKNFIPILPNTDYYKHSPKTSFYWHCYYDKEKNFIGSSGHGMNAVFRTPSNAFYMKTFSGESYGVTYNHDICINLSDTSINGKYFPYVKRTEDLSIIRKYFPQGMKSAGTAHDEIRYNKVTQKWEMVQRIGEVKMKDLKWVYNTSTIFSATISGMYIAKNNDERKDGILSAKYGISESPNVSTAMSDKSILGGSQIYLRDTSYSDDTSLKASFTDDDILYYELAEPIVTELDAEDQFKDLDYQVWNAGTEKAIAEGKSAPLAADITYGFNAIGKIKELESLVAALRAKVGI